ncbi:MAG TPA: rhodanese-like domain-containing protein [Gemmatimonadaceae bacterium]|nr:rhodanese-like domain-containing protein [Gemmatimonadaceae bacterium]
MPIKTAEQMLADAKSQITEYTPAEVMAMQKRGEKLVLLDVRDLPEVNLGRIPGAIHISRGRLEQNIEAAVPRDANVVIYCSNGNRSALAAVTLRDMGYEHVSSMSSGINGWTASDGEVE